MEGLEPLRRGGFVADFWDGQQRRHSKGGSIRVEAPLIGLSKPEIIRRGTEVGIDYAMTVSCYQADAAGLACGRCDSCRIRAEGFRLARVADPTRYAPGRVPDSPD